MGKKKRRKPEPEPAPAKTFEAYLQEARDRLAMASKAPNNNMSPAALDWTVNNPWLMPKANAAAPVVYPPTTGLIDTTPLTKPADPLNM
jgi:hypothetical protein